MIMIMREKIKPYLSASSSIDSVFPEYKPLPISALFSQPLPPRPHLRPLLPLKFENYIRGCEM